MTSISLDDADVWDDSALIRSWDQALDEYKVKLQILGQILRTLGDMH